MSYRYRFCPRCRREWPAKHSSCPNCRHWLGDRPLERTEWQITPLAGKGATATRYELVGGAAVMVRAVSEHPPDDTLQMLAHPLQEAFERDEGSAAYPIRDHGWFLWTGGLRHAFLQALDAQARLVALLQQTEELLHQGVRFRWGLWVDQYILPIGANRMPRLSEVAAERIFNFEPDNLLQCSEAVYKANRGWEHFVCGPRRLLAGQEDFGYQLLGHKRPSALDHAQAGDASPFVGREDEFAILDDCYRDSRGRTLRAALIADAGSGKTRLVREWHRRHPDLRMLTGNFSLFGGDLVSFANQLAELPADRITIENAVAAVLGRIEREAVEVLVLDDIHWADGDGVAFIRHLLDALASKKVLALLVTRPSGRQNLAALTPDRAVELPPLANQVSQELAERLAGSSHVAVAAAQHAKGNPLFLEHFALWAKETGYRGGAHAPASLHQVIAARIVHLSKTRLEDIQQRLRWGAAWDRESIRQALAGLEREIGLWLDRLETGDYGDRVEVSRHLVELERLDFEIFLAGTLSGQPRPRSSRLREAIERLTAGSAKQILADLKDRAAHANDAEKINILNEARRAAQVVADKYDWQLGSEFHALALALADPRHQEEIASALEECRSRLSSSPIDLSRDADTSWLDDNPAVDELKLPEAWARLALCCGQQAYVRRVLEAAEAVHDRRYIQWARARLLASDDHRAS